MHVLRQRNVPKRGELPLPAHRRKCSTAAGAVDSTICVQALRDRKVHKRGELPLHAQRRERTASTAAWIGDEDLLCVPTTKGERTWRLLGQPVEQGTRRAEVHSVHRRVRPAAGAAAGAGVIATAAAGAPASAVHQGSRRAVQHPRHEWVD